MRKVLCVLLLSAFAFAGDKMPLPQKLLSAKTVYIDNRSGDAKFADGIYSELKKTGRLTVVESRSKADVVMRLTSAQVFDSGDSILTGTMEVIDPRTDDVLYSASRRRRGIGNQAAKLVDDMIKRMR